MLLAAGLDGIKNDLTPPDAVAANIYDFDIGERAAAGIEALPTDLNNAVLEMKADPFIEKTLGDHVFNKYTEAKEREWYDFSTTVTEWELDQYLNKF